MILVGFNGTAGVVTAMEALKRNCLVPSSTVVTSCHPDWQLAVSRYINLPDYANDGVRRRIMIRKCGIRVFHIELQELGSE